MFKLTMIAIVLIKLFFIYNLISMSNLIFKFIMLISIFNIFLLYLFGYLNLGVLLVEGLLLVVVMFGEIYSLDLNFLLFTHIMVPLSFLALSFTMIKTSYSMVFLFYTLVFKSLLISLFIMIFKNYSLSILLFMLCSKGFVFFYGVLLSNFPHKEMVLSCVYSNLGCILTLISWGVLLLGAYTLLLCGEDSEGYFLVMLNISHMTVLFSCFFSLKMFLMSFLLDSVIFILFMTLLALKVNPIHCFSFSGNWGSLFLFLFLGHMLGIPPFLTFFLEVGFVYSHYYFLLGILKMLFLLILYVLVVIQFCILFLYLGSLANKPKSCVDFSSSPYVVCVMLLGVFISLCFQFFLFYSV